MAQKIQNFADPETAKIVSKKKNPINSCRFVRGNGCLCTTLNGSSCKKKQKTGKCLVLS